MAEIRVFHSHIEVFPYKEGDCPEIEKMMSVWDPKTFKRDKIGFYILNDVLYLPRGVNTALLERWFKTTPAPSSGCDKFGKFKTGVVKFKPKNTIQENGISFLTGENDYAYTNRYSQLGLNMDTGDGKTFTTVTAILKLKIKAIIITHKEVLKSQWIKTFTEMTTFPEDRIMDITGAHDMERIMDGEVDADIYCVNHQTISSFASKYDWIAVREFFKKIKVGIKVIDEAHKFFENILMIDYFSNCYKSFYLTATYGRSSSGESSIYKTAFSSLARYGEETITYKEKRKHTTLVIIYYNSRPQYGIPPDVRTYYGFSFYKYIDYELEQDPNHSLEKVIYKILDQTKQLNGKTLIISPKKSSVDTIAEMVGNYTGEEVGTVYSDNSTEENMINRDKRIISSTIKSIGEGDDIKDLRILINLQPISSKLLVDQLRGRLRQFSDTDDTFLFYPVDLTVKDTVRFLKRVLPTLTKKCKEIVVMNMSV